MTEALTVAGEDDYVVDRDESSSELQRTPGGAFYARYQLAPKLAIAGRGEFMADRGGLFSGSRRNLNQGTLTLEYKFAEGFLERAELRRDDPSNPYFLTNTLGVLRTYQETLGVGLEWWFSPKRGAW